MEISADSETPRAVRRSSLQPLTTAASDAFHAAGCSAGVARAEAPLLVPSDLPSRRGDARRLWALLSFAPNTHILPLIRAPLVLVPLAPAFAVLSCFVRVRLLPGALSVIGTLFAARLAPIGTRAPAVKIFERLHLAAHATLLRGQAMN